MLLHPARKYKVVAYHKRSFCGGIANFILSKAVEPAIEARGYRLTKVSELTALADKCGSDKGTRGSAHMYTRVYEKLLAPLRDRPICLLEIGLMVSYIDKRKSICAAEGATTAKATDAPSLRMWRTYLPKSILYGFDIDDFSAVQIDGCTIVRGDMSSRDDLDRLIKTIGRPIDVVIDDASHASHHQQIALGSLFPHVRPGGLYIIEDLTYQPPEIEQADAPKTRSVLRTFSEAGILQSPYLSPEEADYIRQNVSDVALHDSVTRVVDDGADALAVIRKK